MIAAGVLLVTLLLAEVMMRVYHHFRPLYCFYDQSYNRFRGSPFAEDWDFQLNSRGFKDVEFTEEKKTAMRILGLGDSFAFGVVPYRYNYYTRLEEILREAGLDVEVINMGIPQTGPDEYLNLLKVEGLKFNPDLVIVSFFVGNDFSDASGSRLRKKLYEYSFLASFINYLVFIRPHVEGGNAHGTGEYIDDAPNFSEEAFLKIQQGRSYIFRTDNPRLLSELNVTVSILKEMQSTCAQRGIDLFVLIIPDEMQVNRELQSKIIAGFPEPTKWDWARPNKQLAGRLAELGIQYLDLYASFKSAARQTNLYRFRDTHWNIAGNELAACLLGQKLIDSEMLRNTLACLLGPPGVLLRQKSCLRSSETTTDRAFFSRRFPGKNCSGGGDLLW